MDISGESEAKIESAPIDPQVSTEHLETPKSDSNSKVRLLIILVTILAILLIGAIYIILNNGFLNGINLKKEGNPTSIQDTMQLNDEKLIYQKDEQLWLLTTAGESKQITTNQNIFRFQQSNDGSVVAFITGEKTTNPNNYTYIIPSSVYVYLTDSGLGKKVYELTPKDFGQSDYAISIKDVEVSEDGSKVAITTSDSLFVYDVASQKLETVFSFPITTPEQSMVYAYSDPQFSPDNTKILFRKGYYEGSSSAFVDLTNNEVKDLPYQAYTSGQTTLGWLDNSTLIINKIQDGDTESASSTIQTVKLAEPDNQILVASLEGLIYSSYIFSDKVYAISLHQKMNYNVYPNANPPYSENYFSVYEFNLQTKSSKLLHSVKQETIINDAISKSYNKLKVSTDGKKLFISGQTGINNKPNPINYTPVIMVLDLKKMGEPVELVQNASF